MTTIPRNRQDAYALKQELWKQLLAIDHQLADRFAALCCYYVNQELVLMRSLMVHQNHLNGGGHEDGDKAGLDYFLAGLRGGARIIDSIHPVPDAVDAGIKQKEN